MVFFIVDGRFLIANSRFFIVNGIEGVGACFYSYKI